LFYLIVYQDKILKDYLEKVLVSPFSENVSFVPKSHLFIVIEYHYTYQKTMCLEAKSIISSFKNEN